VVFFAGFRRGPKTSFEAVRNEELKKKGATEMTDTRLLVRVDAEIAEQHLLKHPFYQDWQAGKLNREDLRLYAAQYYRHVEAFPVHLRTLALRSTGALRELILENLAEEENPRAPHAKLWGDFATAVGVTEEQLRSSAPLPGTRRLLQAYAETCRERSLEEAVAALYAYEAQVPEIATSKIDGLRRHYGICSPEALAYFEVHQEADRMHRAAWRRWLETSEQDSEGADGVVATAKEALGVLWSALDDIQGSDVLGRAKTFPPNRNTNGELSPGVGAEPWVVVEAPQHNQPRN
jgi:pyrroloquinoline-quinone synthase